MNHPDPQPGAITHRPPARRLEHPSANTGPNTSASAPPADARTGPTARPVLHLRRARPAQGQPA